ncbi:hypothetical protein B0H16DRAFT_1469291 [Mycena metata]|uniref:Uncharacterized protein n=1 Tax=Mycena metata TaxID=1033252 RepID=A0AAD7MTA9_9AGAR|nr:hypothetical protein B0H16DRAFT_1469291 [Mycena metata]
MPWVRTRRNTRRPEIRRMKVKDRGMNNLLGFGATLLKIRPAKEQHGASAQKKARRAKGGRLDKSTHRPLLHPNCATWYIVSLHRAAELRAGVRIAAPEDGVLWKEGGWKRTELEGGEVGINLELGGGEIRRIAAHERRALREIATTSEKSSADSCRGRWSRWVNCRSSAHVISFCLALKLGFLVGAEGNEGREGRKGGQVVRLVVARCPWLYSACPCVAEERPAMVADGEKEDVFRRRSARVYSLGERSARTALMRLVFNLADGALNLTERGVEREDNLAFNSGPILHPTESPYNFAWLFETRVLYSSFGMVLAENLWLETFERVIEDPDRRGVGSVAEGISCTIVQHSTFGLGTRGSQLNIELEEDTVIVSARWRSERFLSRIKSASDEPPVDTNLAWEPEVDESLSLRIHGTPVSNSVGLEHRYEQKQTDDARRPNWMCESADQAKVAWWQEARLSGGAGNHWIKSAPVFPRFISVDYIRGSGFSNPITLFSTLFLTDTRTN